MRDSTIMSLFHKLFGTPELRRARRLLKDTRASVGATYGPLGKLGTAIVGAAFSAQQNLAQVFRFSMEGQPSEPQILMFYEFLYFFSHLTLRTAVAKGFTESQIEKLQGVLGPLVASTAVDSFFRHWPEDLKTKMRNEFYGKLNDAEVEYSECRGLLSADDPLSTDTLIGRLAGNAANLWERSSDELAKMAVASAATQAFRAIQLDGLVGEVAAVIGSADSELMDRFWRQ